MMKLAGKANLKMEPPVEPKKMLCTLPPPPAWDDEEVGYRR